MAKCSSSYGWIWCQNVSLLLINLLYKNITLHNPNFQSYFTHKKFKRKGYFLNYLLATISLTALRWSPVVEVPIFSLSLSYTHTHNFENERSGWVKGNIVNKHTVDWTPCKECVNGDENNLQNKPEWSSPERYTHAQSERVENVLYVRAGHI